MDVSVMLYLFGIVLLLIYNYWVVTKRKRRKAERGPNPSGSIQYSNYHEQHYDDGTVKYTPRLGTSKKVKVSEHDEVECVMLSDEIVKVYHDDDSFDEYGPYVRVFYKSGHEEIINVKYTDRDTVTH